jgi:hypothetical protein
MTRKENKSVCAQPLNEQHLLGKEEVRKNWIAWKVAARVVIGGLLEQLLFTRSNFFGVPLPQIIKKFNSK